VGPGLVNLANGLIGLGLVHFFRRHPARWKRSTAQGLPGGLGIAVPASLLLGPAAAVRWERAVVLRNRSTLRGGLPSPIGLLQVGLMAVALSRLRPALRTGDPAEEADPVAPTGS
jgi:hypothetical protein